MNIILGVVVFTAWVAFILAQIGRQAVKDVSSANSFRGISIFPSLVVSPTLIMLVVVAVSHYLPYWALWTLIGIHGLLIFVSIFIFISAKNYLREK